ncbi:MAG: hypothetical protein AAGE84_30680, partial [Cyanobacteria bacterium P01_G01_bin.39]
MTNGRFFYSQDIDTADGQSGSGVWHTIDDDDPPHVLGVHTNGVDSEFNLNSGRLITKDIYDKIVAQIQKDSGTENADKLPENAIIGSDQNDEIEGTYRKERILGNAGQDTISGGDANDRLEGGFGNDTLDGGEGNDRLQGDNNNDYLDGGEGNIDVAVFSEEYTTENYSYSISEDGAEITISHIGGTRNDGVDTLKNIEWGIFNGEQQPLESLALTTSDTETIAAVAAATGSAPRIIPLPLTDGVEDTEI